MSMLSKDIHHIKRKEEMHMSVLTLTASNFETEVLKAAKPVVVDFWATWCGPCRMQGPIIDRMAEKRDDIIFGKVNVDEEEALAMHYGISSIPTLLFFKDGKLVNQTVGVTPEAKIAQMLSE